MPLFAVTRDEYEPYNNAYFCLPREHPGLDLQGSRARVGFHELSIIAPATGEQLLGLSLEEVKTCEELRSC